MHAPLLFHFTILLISEDLDSNTLTPLATTNLETSWILQLDNLFSCQLEHEFKYGFHLYCLYKILLIIFLCNNYKDWLKNVIEEFRIIHVIKVAPLSPTPFTNQRRASIIRVLTEHQGTSHKALLFENVSLFDIYNKILVFMKNGIFYLY